MSRLADYLNEKRVRFYQNLLVKADTREAKIKAWEKLKEAINNRSPEQIERMERGWK